MNFNSIEEVLDYAIGKEKEAVEFYEGLSKRETFQAIKETFADFAKEEEKHVVLLENFSENKEQIRAYKFEWIPDMKRSDYMVDIVYQEDMVFDDVLRLAMKREEKALKLYNELAEKVDDEDMIKMFKILSQEEAKHKRALETIYDDHMAEQGD